jgi:general secretion pathway protein E
MGIEPYLLSSSLIGILAQRLVRRICPECKKAYPASEKELQSIGLDKKDILQLYKGEGCSACYDSGFKGRHGLYELLPVNNAIKKQIVKSPDAMELRQIALETGGMLSLLHHGAELVRKGITTVAEVLRVTRGSEERS